MKIKSGVWYWLVMACFVVGLLYGMGVEGTAQTLGTVSDGAFITAMVLILLAVFFPVWALPPMTGSSRSAARFTSSHATP